ncbi:MAG: TonB C-terminal domain-containing protein [Verrucomicrobiae bacterium]|nr:TonB C-terminal domain-containing protein [Verrucomicrobiae bacterium]MCP5541250.1 TonB C-terminal domain-containing protein [Akkermansiaceae bacterium]
MSGFLEDEDDETFFERHGAKVVALAVLLLAAAGTTWWVTRGPSEKKKKPAAVSMVNIMPPMPPPPPPPPPTPPKDEPEPEPVEQEEAFVPETAPDMAEPEPEAAPDPAPEALGTNIQGDGPPDGFGLRAGGGNGTLGGKRIGGTGGRKGSKFGWYAARVQNSVAGALRANKRTRTASMSIEVKIWADDIGRVTRAQLVSSTGDSGLDRVLRDEVLANVRLSEPPPDDMPMPINLRITARRSN